MAEILEVVTFSREIEGSTQNLIIPEVFVRDFHFYGDEHLTIMLRVTGPDKNKVRDFFEDTTGQIFKIKTVQSNRWKEISEDFILNSAYIDEGPPLSVDIDIEPPMIRAILDFQKKF